MALKNRRWGAVLKRPAFSFTDSSHATTTRHHRCTLKPQPSPTQDPRSHSLTLASFSISQNAYHHGPPRHNPGKDSPRGSVLPETVEETLTTEGRKGYNRRHAASFDLAKRDLGPAEGFVCDGALAINSDSCTALANSLRGQSWTLPFVKRDVDGCQIGLQVKSLFSVHGGMSGDEIANHLTEGIEQCQRNGSVSSRARIIRE